MSGSTTSDVNLVGDETTLNIARAALLASLTGAFAIVGSIPIPFSPVPFTLQVLGVFLAGLLLGPVWGAASMLLYLVAGAVGAPVFAGGAAGIGENGIGIDPTMANEPVSAASSAARAMLSVVSSPTRSTPEVVVPLMSATLPSTDFTVPVDSHRYIYYPLFPYPEATVTDNTEELRDIFEDISDEDTVTETQEDSRGSLTREHASGERLREIIGRMRENHEFESSLSDDELVTVVQRFYDDATDTAIADGLGASRRDVFRARLDLHLIRDRDTDAPFDLAALRDLLDDDRSTGEIADALDVSGSTVRRYRRVVEAQNEARRVSDRFRSEFEDALLEAGMGEEFTDEMADDGLEEATEGTETNVSF